ncbi:MAG TPA: AI-2E family transporter [Pseudolabrys sp.]|jgi:predicted PurR-regulated permease PerM|nr:AI-2E family transporter [Pseudolabrys sp.]
MEFRDLKAERRKDRPAATPAEQRTPTLSSANDPQPISELSRFWRTAAQSATIGMFIILLVAALNLARPLLLPVASAFVVAMMLGPLSARAERYRVPSLLSAIVLWLLVIAIFYGVIILLAAPVVDWLGKTPDIARNIQEKLRVFDRPLSVLQDLRDSFLPSDKKGSLGVDIIAFVQPAMLMVTPAIGQMLIFFGTLFFMLLGRSQLRRFLVVFFDEREARLRTLKIMNDIEHNLTGYLSIVTLINIAVGLCGGFAAWVTGLPDPVAWAVLGFILNFIPYIGALIMEAALFLVGLVMFPTLAQALIAPLLFLALATLEGHFITPSIIGHRLTLNPLTVFLSLVFWTWLWGPVGAFLAVPLLIVGLVVAEHLFPEEEPELPA